MEKFKYNTACKVGNAIENSVDRVILETPNLHDLKKLVSWAFRTTGRTL